jgi:hypothetical protein
LFEATREPHSRRNIEVAAWTLEMDESLIIGLNKYRPFGFTPRTTVELIKKDVEFNDIFIDHSIGVMESKYLSLFRSDIALSLDPNNAVLEGLGLGVGDRESEASPAKEEDTALALVSDAVMI